MAKPKRTDFQREQDLEKITALYLKGWRQIDIAEELGLSRQQIGYDIKTIQKRWRESTAINMDEAKQRELSRIDELEREYWLAWEKSKNERVMARQEKSAKDTIARASMVKEQRDGNPAFLAGVMSCIDRRCKLLGLDAPIKTQNFDIDLSKLTNEQLERIANGEDPIRVVLDGYISANQSAG